METIVILKKDIKFYYYTNYLIRHSPYKTINVILNDIIFDDIGDIIEPIVNSISWNIAPAEYPAVEKVEDGLYVSKGLMKFITIFNNEELLSNFHKFIVVEDYKKISDRMGYL